ncbi:MAG: putative membrane protein YdfK [Firmicutes bacterium]|nr:putative membrane protein YdfK [Bacillota bacterium]MBT9151851.1 putative membrane protein YdfK [Bacillota bacterium]MBT9157132.1 putative membrane protein YdfK [Bacillota bacterium]
MLGTIVNALAIAVGALLGLVLRGGISEKSKETVLHGLGLAVMLIGLTKALETGNPLIVIGSLVLGGLTGEWLDIEGRLYSLAQALEKRFMRGESQIGQAFVTTSLIYCVGAMAITGSLESGLTGNHATLFAKAMLDGVSAIVFASTMGVGVVFSAVAVFFYQGGITLLAGTIAQWLTAAAIREMSATGGLLILAIGINILELKKIRLGNLLPAMFYAVVLTQLF